MLSICLVVLISLLVSAFFSGMEIAFLSSNKLKLEIEKKKSSVFGFIADLFAKYPGQYITTILVGNNIALVVYSLQMSALIRYLLSLAGIPAGSGGAFAVETIVSTVVIIFVAEFIPKAVVRLNPTSYYKTFAVPVYFFYLLFFPLAKLTTLVSIGILKLAGLPLKRDQSIASFDREDLAHLLDEAAEDNESNQTDKDIRLFQNALDFSESSVRDCMVPRVDIEGVERHRSVEEATQQFIGTQFSRLPVYEDTIDNIIGYVTTKSLFRYPKTIDEIINKVDYVPESMPAQRLLTTFIKKRHSMAVVIDEFGGTAGLVTLEDILEEIFGEIEDEHDSQDLVEKKVNDSEYLFSVRLEIDYINEKYRLGLPESEAYDTLAGYVIDRFQGIPSVGETILADNKRIKVLRTDASRLELLRVTVL